MKPKHETLTQACERAERTNPAVAAAAKSYDETVEKILSTFPRHDCEEGKVCSWSGAQRLGDEVCPNGCEGSRRPTVNT